MKAKNGTPMNDARKRQGLSVDDVARRAGVTFWQAARALDGSAEKLSVIKKICRALGLNIADVIGR